MAKTSRRSGEFTVNEGQKDPFDLTWYPSNRDEPSPLNTDKAVQDTQAGGVNGLIVALIKANGVMRYSAR